MNDKEKSPKIVPSNDFIQARLQYLYAMVKGVVDPKLATMCRKVLGDSRFRTCTAARHKHQAYDGGLVVHTAEVLEAALQLATCRHFKVKYDVLVTAIIFHDYGKIWDYVPKTSTSVNEYEYTSHQSLVRHLSRSYAEFMSMDLTTDGKVEDDITQEISHCILAHHGRKEWGSPAEPQTTEAYIIHFADMLSASCALETYKV